MKRSSILTAARLAMPVSEAAISVLCNVDSHTLPLYHFDNVRICNCVLSDAEAAGPMGRTRLACQGL